MNTYVRKTLSLLTKKEKKYIVILMLSVFIMALIELAGVGSLFPYINMLGDQSIIHSNARLAKIYSYFGYSSNNAFLITIGILIFVLIFAKSCLSLLINYMQANFIAKVNIRVSKFCLESYVKMTYSRSLRENTSNLSKHILADVNYAMALLSAILSITTDLLILLSLTVLMLMIDAKLIAIVVVSFFIVAISLVKGTKKKINTLGVQNERYNKKVYQSTFDAIRGFKDIKLYQVENFFINQFDCWRSKFANNGVSYAVVSNVPGVVMNLIGFGMLLVILLYLLVSRGNFQSILPIIGTIAVCVQRMIPSFSRISTQLGVVRQYHVNLEIVHKAVADMEQYRAQAQTTQGCNSNYSFQDSIQLKNVCFSYDSSNKKILNDINLKILKNKSLGIVGRSGSGKSTLVDVILGLLPMQSGSMTLDDKSLPEIGHANLLHLVGYVPQQTYILDATVKENIAFGIEEADINEEAVNKAIRLARLDQHVEELEFGIETNIAENGDKLSGGQRQRIGIARALYHDPEILVMDEATNALDSTTEKEINHSLMHLLGKKTLIIVSHKKSSLDFCDEIIVLDQGKIVGRGNNNELLSQNGEYVALYEN